MILFPNAKINIGLNVLRKRKDSFHDLETVFYPLQLSDILEVNRSSEFEFKQTGIAIEGEIGNNLVVKAYRLLKSRFTLGNVNIHLHKQIPFGAGLGGGSADAAFTLLALNQLFDLKLNKAGLITYASKLGSDCPFFILNCPVLAEGRGDVLNPSKLSLKGWTLVLVKPDSIVNTAQAYSNITPEIPKERLFDLIRKPVGNWTDQVVNHFEKSVFPEHPEIENVKNILYTLGAEYASMSGSGSAVFGLFKNDPGNLKDQFLNCFYRKETCVH